MTTSAARPRGVGAVLDDLSRMSRQQVVIRSIIVLATVVFLGVEHAAGGAASLGVLLLVAVLTLLSAVDPDSGVPFFLLVLLGLHWAAVVPQDSGGWLPVAGVALTVIHVACTTASYGPTALTLPPSLLLRWVGRVLLLVVTMLVAWRLQLWLPSAPSPGAWLLVGALLVLALASGLVAAAIGRDATGRDAR